MARPQKRRARGHTNDARAAAGCSEYSFTNENKQRPAVEEISPPSTHFGHLFPGQSKCRVHVCVCLCVHTSCQMKNDAQLLLEQLQAEAGWLMKVLFLFRSTSRGEVVSGSVCQQ